MTLIRRSSLRRDGGVGHGSGGVRVAQNSSCGPCAQHGPRPPLPAGGRLQRRRPRRARDWLHHKPRRGRGCAAPTQGRPRPSARSGALRRAVHERLVVRPRRSSPLRGRRGTLARRAAPLPAEDRANAPGWSLRNTGAWAIYGASDCNGGAPCSRRNATGRGSARSGLKRATGAFPRRPSPPRMGRSRDPGWSPGSPSPLSSTRMSAPSRDADGWRRERAPSVSVYPLADRSWMHGAM